ncbi:MAG TPA: hypothetical protein VHB97_08945, partial [Polyangia bacterium]|nr:hypothetical protein [Polyangia bacterium]
MATMRICVLVILGAVACGASHNGPGDGGGGGGSAGGGGGGGDPGMPPGPGPLDLCNGLVQDKAPHPMTALSKPARGATVTDAEFGTTIRRITDVGVQATASNSAIVPLYTTMSAWNADESRLLLYSVAAGA